MDFKNQMRVIEFPYSAPQEKSVTSPASGYLGALVRFEDGSRWKMTRILSNIKYQESQPPFEARQVLECVCIDDPQNLHHDAQVAVAKVKYQIHGTRESKFFYWNYAQECKARLDAARRTADDEQAQSDYQHGKQLLDLAIEPTSCPNEYTGNEVAALDHFRRLNLAHAPHLLSFSADYMAEEVDDDRAMDKGYACFLLMNKVPGEPLTGAVFWSKDEKTREEIRCAFKVALMDVWRAGVRPYDSGVRNIVWDEQELKCYIVDFEDYGRNDMDPEILWSDGQYKYWGLAEDC